MNSQTIDNAKIKLLRPVAEFIADRQKGEAKEPLLREYVTFLFSKGQSWQEINDHLNVLIAAFGSVKKSFEAAGYKGIHSPHPHFGSLVVKKFVVDKHFLTMILEENPSPFSKGSQEKTSNALEMDPAAKLKAWMRRFESHCAESGLIPSASEWNRWRNAQQDFISYAVTLMGKPKKPWETLCRENFSDPDQFDSFEGQRGKHRIPLPSVSRRSDNAPSQL